MIITQTPQTCRSLLCNVIHKIHHQITHCQSTRYMHGHKQKTFITLQASCALRLCKIAQIDLLHGAYQNHLQCGCIFEDVNFNFF